jgi:hypothetical protein
MDLYPREFPNYGTSHRILVKKNEKGQKNWAVCHEPQLSHLKRYEQLLFSVANPCRFLLTKSPESASWLDQRETSIAIYRIRNDTKIKVTRQISKKNIIAAMTDPKVYLFMAMNLIMTIPSRPTFENYVGCFVPILI